jgi:DNA polymerase-3 subunit beta
MVATDGRRLAFIEKSAGDIPDFPGAIIPVKVLVAIVKYAGDEGQISISITDKFLFIEFGSYKFCSVLFDGQFPNYRKVIPENQSCSFTVKKSDILQAMKRVHPLVEKQSERLYFKIVQGALSIYVKDSDIGSGEEEIEAEFSGEEMQFALRYSNLEEPLRMLTTDMLKVQFTDISHAFTIKPEPEDDYYHVMMPMQIEV